MEKEDIETPLPNKFWPRKHLTDMFDQLSTIGIISGWEAYWFQHHHRCHIEPLIRRMQEINLPKASLTPTQFILFIVTNRSRHSVSKWNIFFCCFERMLTGQRSQLQPLTYCGSSTCPLTTHISSSNSSFRLRSKRLYHIRQVEDVNYSDIIMLI